MTKQDESQLNLFLEFKFTVGGIKRMYEGTKCLSCYTGLSMWIKTEFCEAPFLPNVSILTCSDSNSLKVMVAIFFTV